MLILIKAIGMLVGLSFKNYGQKSVSELIKKKRINKKG